VSGIVPERVPGLRFASPGTTARGFLDVGLSARQKHGTLYAGVTNALSRRIAEHRDGQGSEFASRYGALRLAYTEHFDDPGEAIAHEKRLKHRRRSWKVALIERANPVWNDLYPTAHLD
jgi:putative endonuclease